MRNFAFFSTSKVNIERIPLPVRLKKYNILSSGKIRGLSDRSTAFCCFEYALLSTEP